MESGFCLEIQVFYELCWSDRYIYLLLELSKLSNTIFKSLIMYMALLAYVGYSFKMLSMFTLIWHRLGRMCYLLY